jgi:hypothetical protein
MLAAGSNEQLKTGVMCGADPSAAWVASRTRRGSLPVAAAPCKQSKWVNVVLSHTFELRPGGQQNVKTPAVIHADGSVTTG